MDLKTEINGLLDSYAEWTRDSLKTHHIDGGGGTVVLTTPFLDRHNDMLQVLVKRTGTGYELSDDGHVIADLEAGGCDLGTPERRALLDEIARGFNLLVADRTLLTLATRETFGKRKHDLVQGMVAVGGLFHVVKPGIADN